MGRSAAIAFVLAAVVGGCGDPLVVVGDLPGFMRVVAGVPDSAGTTVDASALRTRLYDPSAIALGDSGRILFIADQRGRILRITTAGDAEELLDHSTCTGTMCLRRPQGMTFHNDGLLIADDLAHRVWRFDLGTLSLTPFAGTGINGVTADGVAATQARLSAPTDVAILPDGRVLFAERNSNSIRVVGPDGILRTFASNIQLPWGLAVANNLVYVTQLALHNVLELGLDGALLRTVAGNGSPGFEGDNGPATEASLRSPQFITVAGDNLFISDRDNARIRQVNLQTGIITTFAGTGSTVYNGSGRAAGDTSLENPAALVYSPYGFLYIVDQGHHIVWRTSVSAGIL
jgi:hypothetical protein